MNNKQADRAINAELNRIDRLTEREVKRATKLLRDAHMAIKRNLDIAWERIYANGVGSGVGEYRAVYLQQMKGDVERVMAEFRQKYMDEYPELIASIDERATQLVRKPLARHGIQVNMSGLGIGTVETLSKFHTDQIVGIADEAKKAINTELSVSMLSGADKETLKANISRHLPDAKGAGTIGQRATRIIRTEVNRVHSIATYDRLKQAEKVVPELKKYWLPAKRNTRPSHLKAGIEYGSTNPIPINAPFFVDGNPCQHPRDASLPVGEVVNCQCRLVPVLPTNVQYRQAEPVAEEKPKPAKPNLNLIGRALVKEEKGGALSKESMKHISSAGATGREMPIDGGDIEGLAVRYVEVADANNKPRTYATMRLRESGNDKIMDIIKQYDAVADINPMDNVVDMFQGLLKEIAYGSNNGKSMSDLLDELSKVSNRLLGEISAGNITPAIGTHYKSIIEKMTERFVAGGDFGRRFVTRPDVPPLASSGNVFKKGKREWVVTREKMKLEKANLDRAKMKLTGEFEERDGYDNFQYRLEANDGTRLVYRPYHSDNQYSTWGQLEVSEAGEIGRNRTVRLGKALKDFGIKGEIADDMAIEIMYISRNAHLMKWTDEAEFKKIDRLKTPSKKLERLRDYISKKMGVNSVDEIEGYDPKIEWRETAYRAGEVTSEKGTTGKMYQKNFVVDKFMPDADQYTIGHKLTYSGGNMVDKLTVLLKSTGRMASVESRGRMGIGFDGASASADMRTGGANQIFMRLDRKGSYTRELEFDAKRMLSERSDYYAHDSDRYGMAMPKSLGRKYGVDGGRDDWFDDRIPLTEFHRTDEIMFRDDISLADYLVKINVDSPEEVQRLIDNLKDMNLKKLGDKDMRDLIHYGGRTLREFGDAFGIDTSWFDE